MGNVYEQKPADAIIDTFIFIALRIVCIVDYETERASERSSERARIRVYWLTFAKRVRALFIILNGRKRRERRDFQGRFAKISFFSRHCDEKFSMVEVRAGGR